MKKTISINLNGMLFNIDDDAYDRLEEYMKRIEAHFSGQNESNEIMNDIEARIAELLNERLGGTNKVVSLSDIEEIIKTMGNPDEFDEAEQKDQKKQHYQYIHRPRRLYRDPDNRVIGGVCGGMGAYMNVDPVIFRIIFVIIFFGFGVGLLIYLVLWIVIPEAKTTAQKLEMRGDPVNVSNIGSFFREEFENVKNSFSGKKHRS
jgi:phage shock protein PspC (stress-responsive transcriptional regulator)